MSKIYQRIKDVHGIEAMRLVWIEELNELSAALARETRTDKTPDKVELLTEIADVRIILDQMVNVYLTKEERSEMFKIESEKINGLTEKLGL